MLIAGGVARIALNRPDKRNALDRDTIDELTAILRRCGEDADARVVQNYRRRAMCFAQAPISRRCGARPGLRFAESCPRANPWLARWVTLDINAQADVARVNGDGYGGALGLIWRVRIVVAVGAPSSPSPRCASG